jgi:uncharacterized protein
MIATDRRDRIAALDVARGLALLGIFLVNIHAMADSMGVWLLELEGRTVAGDGLSAIDQVAVAGVYLWCAGKFYPLFSMLFGMGFVLLLDRATAAGHGVAGLYLRRLGLLLVLGLLHGWLLWFGDVLAMYAVCGVVLLLVRAWSARALLIVGAGLYLAGGLASLSFAVGMEWLSTLEPGVPTPAEAVGIEPGSRFVQMFEGFGSGAIDDIDSPLYIALEREAMAEGPWYDAVGFHLWTWALVVVSMVLGLGWQAAGLFMVGAGLMRGGVMSPGRSRARTRLATAGLAIGLGLSILTYAGVRGAGDPWGGVLAYSGPAVVGGVLSLGYLMGAAVACDRGWLPWLRVGLAAAGRLALTNYLMQSLIASLAFRYWGLGLYGELSASQRVGFVLAVFAGQVVASVAWLRVFRMGPMEWVWRVATYGRYQPMRRVV